MVSSDYSQYGIHSVLFAGSINTRRGIRPGFAATTTMGRELEYTPQSVTESTSDFQAHDFSACMSIHHKGATTLRTQGVTRVRVWVYDEIITFVGLDTSLQMLGP